MSIHAAQRIQLLKTRSQCIQDRWCSAPEVFLILEKAYPKIDPETVTLVEWIKPGERPSRLITLLEFEAHVGFTHSQTDVSILYPQPIFDLFALKKIVELKPELSDTINDRLIHLLSTYERVAEFLKENPHYRNEKIYANYFSTSSQLIRTLLQDETPTLLGRERYELDELNYEWDTNKSRPPLIERSS